MHGDREKRIFVLTYSVMLHTLFFILPFMTCLLWTVLFVLHWRKHNKAQHVLLLFSSVCTVLYGCHACYFLGKGNEVVEFIWRTCSLACYPLYYLYIVYLTTHEARTPWYHWLLLLPALVLPTIQHFVPAVEYSYTQQIAFILLVLVVCVAGLGRLTRMEKEVFNYYADTEDKSSHRIITLLVCFVLTSCCSVVFNVIGRETFRADLLVIIPSVLFSVMLFAVFYIGDSYVFTARQMVSDEPAPAPPALDEEAELSEEQQAAFVEKLNYLMEVEQLFLTPNLKIRDVALRVGTNRTYLSNYLNQSLHLSFSDYINGQRIRYAEQLKASDPSLTVSFLTIAAGFASEQSFLRNYRKFATKPA